MTSSNQKRLEEKRSFSNGFWFHFGIFFGAFVIWLPAGYGFWLDEFREYGFGELWHLWFILPFGPGLMAHILMYWPLILLDELGFTKESETEKRFISNWKGKRSGIFLRGAVLPMLISAGVALVGLMEWSMDVEFYWFSLVALAVLSPLVPRIMMRRWTRDTPVPFGSSASTKARRSFCIGITAARKEPNRRRRALGG